MSFLGHFWLAQKWAIFEQLKNGPFLSALLKIGPFLSSKMAPFLALASACTVPALAGG